MAPKTSLTTVVDMNAVKNFASFRGDDFEGGPELLEPRHQRIYFRHIQINFFSTQMLGVWYHTTRRKAEMQLSGRKRRTLFVCPFVVDPPISMSKQVLRVNKPCGSNLVWKGLCWVAIFYQRHQHSPCAGWWSGYSWPGRRKLRQFTAFFAVFFLTDYPPNPNWKGTLWTTGQMFLPFFRKRDGYQSSLFLKKPAAGKCLKNGLEIL